MSVLKMIAIAHIQDVPKLASQSIRVGSIIKINAKNPNKHFF